MKTTPCFPDELEDDHGQARRRAAHREGRSLDGTDDEAADDAGHQAEGRGHSRRQGDAQAERKGYEEHHNGGEDVRPQGTQAR
jgi:hypothetical protein